MSRERRVGSSRLLWHHHCHHVAPHAVLLLLCVIITIHPIGMDFIGPFTEVNGYNYLWVVICRMTSMVHLVPVNTKTTASQLSAIYVQEIVRLHELPSSIVCDRDPKLMLKWWHELHRIMGTKLLMSTSFHLQIDGATERANRFIGQIFWALIKPDCYSTLL